ncbi:MAG: DUF1801 domain-containing protein [Patescibacteria group bacterium]
MKKIRSVSEYIATAPKPSQPILKQLRKIIKVAAPKAEERISYLMPYYSYHGRLIYFAGYAKYVGVYLMDASRKALPKQLQAFRTSKSTLRFPVERKLPSALLRRLIAIQAHANQGRAKTL